MRCKDVMIAWNSLRIRYGGSNLARKLVLTTEINNCVQGDNDVATYYDKLSKYWEELDSIKRVRSCSSIGFCACCHETEDEVKEDRVVKNLVGLNDSFGVVRSNIFAKEEVLHIDKVYEMISQEETQRSAKRGVHIETPAMYGAGHNGYNGMQGKQNNVGRMRSGTSRGKLRVQCSHCQMLGHTKENCYKIIGYPSGWKRDIHMLGSKYFNANNVAVLIDNFSSDGNPGSNLTNEQVEQVYQLLVSLKTGQRPQSNTQMAGIVHSCAIVINKGLWMIDSGATCHFTNNVDFLLTFTPCDMRVM